jgi:hypothetical protein
MTGGRQRSGHGVEVGVIVQRGVQQDDRRAAPLLGVEHLPRSRLDERHRGSLPFD